MIRSMLLVLMLPATVFAQDVSPETMEAATGLAQIMARANHCRYEIDPKKLESYYVTESMAKPAVLAWISMKVSQETGWADQTTEAECVITRATAQGLGLLK